MERSIARIVCHNRCHMLKHDIGEGEGRGEWGNRGRRSEGRLPGQTLHFERPRSRGAGALWKEAREGRERAEGKP